MPEMEELIALSEQGQFEEVWKRLRGFYECPRGPNGERLGPLVTYAGKDSRGRHLVGDGYFNFAVPEQYPAICKPVAQRIWKSLGEDIQSQAIGFLGAAMGGVFLASDLAYVSGKERAIAEKKTTKVETETAREKFTISPRHDIEPGSKWILVEDVVNNLSTTQEICRAVEERGGEIIAIACSLNRSPREVFDYNGRLIPIHCDIRRPMPQYEVDDPEVVEYIQKDPIGNVVVKPKAEWGRLQEAVDRNKSVEPVSS